jgi:transcriptional/translational regulatory protein YebC/TACO1
MPELTFDDALRIARGCTDYGGGYHGEEYQTYQHGIQTVINALTSAKERGLSDTQVAALHRMGA